MFTRIPSWSCKSETNRGRRCLEHGRERFKEIKHLRMDVICIQHGPCNIDTESSSPNGTMHTSYIVHTTTCYFSCSFFLVRLLLRRLPLEIINSSCICKRQEEVLVAGPAEQEKETMTKQRQLLH